jgi:hypothetical protein
MRDIKFLSECKKGIFKTKRNEISFLIKNVPNF